MKIKMIRVKITVLSIVLILGATHCSKELPPYVPFSAQLIYDESHNNVWRLWDHGYCGYSSIVDICNQYGILASTNTISLDECINNFSSGFQYTIVMISVAKYQKFKSSEIAALRSFVNSGGRLLIVGEHDNMYNCADFLNDLVKHFGIHINKDGVGNEEHAITTITALNNPAYSPAFGLNNVLHMLAASISCTDCTSLLYDSRTKKPIAVGTTYGKGKIIVIGDSELLWNADGKIGIHAGENTKFFICCMEWLLEKRLNPLNHGIYSTSSVKIFDSFNSSVSIHPTPSGVTYFIEAIIRKLPWLLHNPTVNIIVIPRNQFQLQRNRRNIVFIEPFQQLMPSSVWGKRLLALGAQNTNAYKGVLDSNWQIQPCFITDGDTTFYDITLPFKNRTLQFHTLAGISISEKVKKSYRSKMLFIPSHLWGEVSHPGLEVANEGIPLYQHNDIDDLAYMYWDDAILLIGDADAIANQNKNTETFNQMVDLVVDWIKMKL